MDINTIAQCVHGAVPKMVVDRFNDMLLEFMLNLKNTFQGYELKFTTAMNELHLAITIGTADVPIKLFAQAMGDTGYQKCIEKQEAFIFELFSSVKFLVEFDVKAIWTECPESVRNNIWLYLIELASLVRSYKKATAVSKDDVVHKMQQMEKRMDSMLQSGMSPNQIMSTMIGQAAAINK